MRPNSLRPRASLALVAAAGLLLAACQQTGAGSAGPSTAGGALELTVSHTEAGDALAGAGGMTLYILTEDTGGTSTCNTGGCATTWPALKGDGADVQKGTGVSGTFATTTWAGRHQAGDPQRSAALLLQRRHRPRRLEWAGDQRGLVHRPGR